MKTRTFLLATLFGLPTATLASTLYKCTDRAGVVLFTNQKPSQKNCRVLIQQTGPAAAPAVRSGPAARPTPSDFPRVSGDQQQSRDSDRRAILEQELASEQKSLQQAQAALATANPQTASGLRDSVALHQRNIEALRKELGRLH